MNPSHAVPNHYPHGWPPPVLDKLLQKRNVRFRTPSGVDKMKLAIRFDISMNPTDDAHTVQLWDVAEGLYVNISTADWDKPVFPHTVIQTMNLCMPHTNSHDDQFHLFEREGLHLKHVFCAIYDMYDRVLSDEDIVTYAKVIKTQSFHDWFKKRCNSLSNPDQARRLGYKHVDLLQGNVFFADLKPITLDSWIVRIVLDPGNELRFGVSISSFP
ncbi:hypothetical protein CPB85DRAFT_1357732 [Mucidula mucida]|nr:hypothetical protein CPB85DRAFT_1357732 [Mucidula mucida]